MRNASRPSVCLVLVVSFVLPLCPVVPRASAQPADASACAPRGWAAPSPRSPTMRRRRGGTRRAWPAAPTSTPSSSRATTASRRPTAPPPATRAARRAETRSFAVAFPALGLSYYRLRVSEIQPQTSTAAGRRRPTRWGSDGGPSALDCAEPVRRVGRPVPRLAPGRRIDVKLVNAGARLTCRPRPPVRWMRQPTSIPQEKRTRAWTSGRWRCSAACGLG